MNDRAWSRFLAGDPEQVRQIRTGILKVVRAFNPPGADLEEDLVQDALARLVVSLKEGRFRGECSLETYAQSVAKHVCLEHRRRGRMVTGLEPDRQPSRAHWSGPEASILDSEEHHRSLKIFAALPAECRELLVLINVQGLSYREVGERLGITEGAIKSRVRRMRAVIRDLLSTRRRRPLSRRTEPGSVSE